MSEQEASARLFVLESTMLTLDSKVSRLLVAADPTMVNAAASTIVSYENYDISSVADLSSSALES